MSFFEIARNAYSIVKSVFIPTVAKEDWGSSNFIEGRQKCKDCITHTFLKVLKKRPVLSPDDNQPHTYWIIFRQSYSWEEIKNKFSRISPTDNSVAKQVSETWIRYINELDRLNQTRLQNLNEANRLNPCFENQKNPPLLYPQELINLYSCMLEEANTLSQNQDLKQHNECYEAIRLIAYKWSDLWSFLDWCEIPLNSRELFVRVEKLDKPGARLSDYAHTFNKAIYEVKESVNSKDWQYGDKNVMKLLTPEKAQITDLAYSASTPHAPQKSLSQIQVETIAHQIEGVNLDGMNRFQPQESKIGVTAIAPVTYKIVNEAIADVNNKLPINAA